MRYADKRASLMFLEGRTGLLARLVRVFLQTAPQTVEDLSRAVEGGDTGEVLRLAHGLKNSAGMLCLEPLGRICLELECAARDGVPGRFAPLLTELRTVFSETEAELSGEEWK